MWKKHAHNMIWGCILLGFLCIPIADIRLFQNIPLYPLDSILLAIIGVSFWIVKEKQFKDEEKADLQKIGLLFGLVMIGSILSWYISEGTLTSLGQIKSWIVLPGAAGLLAAVALQGKEREKKMLFLWFLGLLSLLGFLLPYVFTHTLTFDGRLQGPFTSPNFLGFFVFPAIVLSYYFWHKNRVQKLAPLLILAGIFFSYILFATHSFSAWLALGGTLTWYGGYLGNAKKHTKKILMVVFLLVIFIGGELVVSDKIESIVQERSSLASRITIWKVAGLALYDQPVLGIGMGKFQQVYLSYQPLFPPYLEWAVPQPHNIAFALWLQTGIIGLIGMGGLLKKALFQKRNNHKETVLLQALLVGMLVYGIFDTPLFGNALSFVWWLTLGILLYSPASGKSAPVNK